MLCTLLARAETSHQCTLLLDLSYFDFAETAGTVITFHAFFRLIPPV